MKTHEDNFHRKGWIRSLEAKSKRMHATGQSTIAGGDKDELVLGEWKSNGVYVRHLPDDEHSILRISIGGGETPVPLNYCTIRGDHARCIDLLRKALSALEAGPP